MRIFSSASDAPKARRPTDVILLLLSVLGVVILSFFAPGPTAIDKTLSDLVHELPGLFGWFWEISYDLMIGWALLLLILALFARGRKRLFLTELIAGSLALGFAMLAGRVAGTDWSSSLEALSAKGTPPVYLAVRLAIATAVVVMASPYMSRPLRFIGRWVVTVGAVAGIALGVTLPIGMVAGLLIGLGSAAIIHLILGSPAGRLTLDQIAIALGDLGVAATDLRHAPLEPSGVALALRRPPTVRRSCSRCTAGTRGTDSSSLRSGRRCGAGASVRASGSAASSRWSTRRSSRCSPSERVCRSSRSWPPGWRTNATPCWSARSPDGRSVPSTRATWTIKRCRGSGAPP